MRLLSIWFALGTLAICLAAEPPSGQLPRRVDLNNASKEALETLPGIGPKLAQEIMAGRPYRSVEELDRVKGIGPKKLAELRPRVFITPMAAAATRPAPAPAKVNINTASQQDLEKLPDIGPKRAEAIIKARPFQRIEDLMKISGIKQVQFEKLKDKVTVR